MEIKVLQITTQTLTKGMFAQLEQAEPKGFADDIIVGWVNYEGTWMLATVRGQLVKLPWAFAFGEVANRLPKDIAYDRRRELVHEWRTKFPQVLLK
jgi:hypothetical protein